METVREQDVETLISVVLSFRNEADVLPEMIRRQEAVFAGLGLRYELIFVNDASTDASLEILLAARKKNPSVKILNTSRRFGNAHCVLAGFERARGDAVIYMDTDLQDPPELIPQLIAKWREGADIVHTTRTVRRGENAFKMWLTRQAYRAINGMADITILQNTGDFKLISRRAMDEILKMPEFDPFLRGLVSWVGFTQVQVLYERDARFAGETKYSLWRNLNPYKEFVRGLTLFSTLPLYLALFIGMAVGLLALLFFAGMLVTALWERGTNGLTWNHLQLGTTLLLGGMILFTVGILGIYVGRIHRESIRRPRYVIRDYIGGE